MMADLNAPLEREIRRIISVAGAMPVSEYMALCLGHPEHGYYMTRDPLGAQGDFTTAPEISQMFGELIGLWAAAAWHHMGKPEAVNLIELGPGLANINYHDLIAYIVQTGWRNDNIMHIV
jgi:NADH dehydrogenase [ubiquinone] 1 alpha subcomplex assembly factor 7